MSIANSLLPEFDQEMQTTRTLLERIPDAEAGWKPHEKSWTLGELSMHVVNVPNWLTVTLDTEVFDVMASDEGRDRNFESTAKLLASFDQSVAIARERLATASDEEFGVNWTFKMGDETKFEMPRITVIRSFVMNHLIHHRGQLSLYLRMNDVALPEIYGPTADSAPPVN